MNSQLMEWEMENGFAADGTGNRLVADETEKWQYFTVLQPFE